MKVENKKTKEKKVKISFFLNKNVKPVTLIIEGKRKGIIYPLYIAVTFNRKNMQFKSKFKSSYQDENKIPADLKAFEERQLTKIIRYENAMLKKNEEFDMKGLSVKYDSYTNPLKTLLEKYLKQRLASGIYDSHNKLLFVLNLDATNTAITVPALYTAAGKLDQKFYDEMDQVLKADIEIYEKLLPVLRSMRFDFPTVIDWLDGSYKEELKMRFANVSNDNEDFIEKVSKMIDGAIAKTKYDEEGIKATEAFKLDAMKSFNLL